MISKPSEIEERVLGRSPITARPLLCLRAGRIAGTRRNQQYKGWRTDVATCIVHAVTFAARRCTHYQHAMFGYCCFSLRVPRSRRRTAGVLVMVGSTSFLLLIITTVNRATLCWLLKSFVECLKRKHSTNSSLPIKYLSSVFFAECSIWQMFCRL